MYGMPSFADPANLEPSAEREVIEIAPDAAPLDFLQAVYRSSAVALHSRLKAAIEAAQYVHHALPLQHP
jgi:hypothetical protein